VKKTWCTSGIRAHPGKEGKKRQPARGERKAIGKISSKPAPSEVSNQANGQRERGRLKCGRRPERERENLWERYGQPAGQKGKLEKFHHHKGKTKLAEKKG